MTVQTFRSRRIVNLGLRSVEVLVEVDCSTDEVSEGDAEVHDGDVEQDFARLAAELSEADEGEHHGQGTQPGEGAGDDDRSSYPGVFALKGFCHR